MGTRTSNAMENGLNNDNPLLIALKAVHPWDMNIFEHLRVHTDKGLPFTVTYHESSPYPPHTLSLKAWTRRSGGRPSVLEQIRLGKLVSQVVLPPFTEQMKVAFRARYTKQLIAAKAHQEQARINAGKLTPGDIPLLGDIDVRGHNTKPALPDTPLMRIAGDSPFEDKAALAPQPPTRDISEVVKVLETDYAAAHPDSEGDKLTHEQTLADPRLEIAGYLKAGWTPRQKYLSLAYIARYGDAKDRIAAIKYIDESIRKAADDLGMSSYQVARAIETGDWTVLAHKSLAQRIAAGDMDAIKLAITSEKVTGLKDGDASTRSPTGVQILNVGQLTLPPEKQRLMDRLDNLLPFPGQQEIIEQPLDSQPDLVQATPLQENSSDGQDSPTLQDQSDGTQPVDREVHSAEAYNRLQGPNSTGRDGVPSAGPRR